MIDCELWHATLGVSAQSTTNVQGFFMSGNHLEAVRTGLLHTHTMVGGNPAGTLVYNDVQFRDFGFDLTNISRWRAAGNQFRNEGLATTTSYDIRFHAASLIVLTGNAFDTPANALRVNILIDAEYVVNGSHFGSHFLIDSHQFGEELPPGHNFGTSAIKITASATDIQIGASNQFIGDFTGPIVDDASQTAATFPGFPTTNASGSAIVPNGTATVGIPTLGSGTIPWPASFSKGHYLPLTTSATGVPGTGWVLYTDTSGNLSIMYRDGTNYVLHSHP